ncbi:MAG: hypothetical protein V4795_00485 [Pseudomonadota bacterium]
MLLLLVVRSIVAELLRVTELPPCGGSRSSAPGRRCRRRAAGQGRQVGELLGLGELAALDRAAGWC